MPRQEPLPAGAGRLGWISAWLSSGGGHLHSLRSGTAERRAQRVESGSRGSRYRRVARFAIAIGIASSVRVGDREFRSITLPRVTSRTVMSSGVRPLSSGGQPLSIQSAMKATSVFQEQRACLRSLGWMSDLRDCRQIGPNSETSSAFAENSSSIASSRLLSLWLRLTSAAPPAKKVPPPMAWRDFHNGRGRNRACNRLCRKSCRARPPNPRKCRRFREPGNKSLETGLAGWGWRNSNLRMAE